MDDGAVQIRISAIGVLGFHQDEPEAPIGDNKHFSVDVQLKTQHNGDDKRARIVLDVSMRRSEDPTSLVVLSIVTEMVFDFKDDTFLVTGEEGKERIRLEILDQLVSVAYSTTRGILFSKLGLSGLSKLILPLLDTKGLTKQYALMPSD